MAVLRIDPIGVYSFYLTLLDSQKTLGTLITAAVNYFVAGFSECSGMDATVEVMEYKEGGRNDHVWKFPTRASHSNITFASFVFLHTRIKTGGRGSSPETAHS